MDDRFYNAFCPTIKHRVLGYELRPFCLRHRLTLEAIGSPCVPGSGIVNPSLPDLLIAARICSGFDVVAALERHSWRDLFRLLRLARNPELSKAELERWRMYVLDTAQHPVTAGKPPKERRDRGLHWSLSVVVSLVSMGFTEEEAWTMPETRAMFYFFAKAIKDGADLDIVTTSLESRLPDAKAAVMKAVAEANARMAAEAKAGKPKRR